MIRCRIYLSLILSLFLVFSGLSVWAIHATDRFELDELPARQQLVRSLSLTDLSLWTEARYTRHPTMADLFSPFQDHPASFEHFPAGGLMAPVSPRPQTTVRISRQGQR